MIRRSDFLYAYINHRNGFVPSLISDQAVSARCVKFTGMDLITESNEKGPIFFLSPEYHLIFKIFCDKYTCRILQGPPNDWLVIAVLVATFPLKLSGT